MNKAELIAADLRRRIHTLQPGDPIPSEQTLREDHQVSRNTVRRALTILHGEGAIHSEQGKGWFVSELADRTWRVRVTKSIVYAATIKAPTSSTAMSIVCNAIRRGDGGTWESDRGITDIFVQEMETETSIQP